jgi:alpha-L-rhamnosidase
VFIPGQKATDVSESGMAAADAPGVKFLRQENNQAVFQIVSGTYQFTAERTSP